MKWVCTRLIIFWMSLLGLLPATHIAELSKIPQLMGHYMQTHRAEVMHVNFLNFLMEHYFSEQDQSVVNNNAASKANQHDHSKLPFFHSVTGAVVFIPAPALVLWVFVESTVATVPTLLPTYLVPTSRLLRPPQV